MLDLLINTNLILTVLHSRQIDKYDVELCPLKGT